MNLYTYKRKEGRKVKRIVIDARDEEYANKLLYCLMLDREKWVLESVKYGVKEWNYKGVVKK